ncbi:Phage integrase family protein [Sphingomonas sp. NFR04]|uniref:site-specific integrase n=1 Tax=Sphingomonas sp. NFR04 TaxID=1566283 RepID=UPI0008E0246A|nr:tyrosine-type recombinase/integrase [Sphingomonas sp. NFR04]SFJ51635.1 Phage integrase family protein [Sphingomonas sp. NFR04]
MERPKVKYCQWQKGTLYFGIKGKDGRTSYTALPHPSHPDFASCYEPLKNAHEARKKAKKEKVDTASGSQRYYITGSFKALVHEAEKSRAYRDMAQSTRENVDRYYRTIIADWGDKLVAELEPADVDRRIDEPDMASYPGKTLNYLKYLADLIDLGIRRGYRKDKYNPARDAERPETGERLPWPDDVYERAIDRASDMIRLAIQLGVYTGQRISDCIRIERQELLACAAAGEPMSLVQKKTGVEVFIPIHPELAAIVEAFPASPDAPTVLYNRLGRPFPKPDQIQDRLKKLMLDLGYFDEVERAGEEKRDTRFKFHGLRKLAACHLVEAGATPHEVSAICGMDIQTVIHYTRGVAKRKLSRGFSDRMNTIKPGQERPDLRLVA